MRKNWKGYIQFKKLERSGYVFLSATYAIWIAHYYWMLHVRFGPILGYPFREVGAEILLIVIVLASIPACALKPRGNTPSHFILHMVYITMYIPLVVVPHFASSEAHADLLLFDTVSLLSFIITIHISGIRRRIQIPKFELTSTSFHGSVLVIAGVMTSFLVINLGLPNQIPSLLDVYDVRSVYKARLREAGGVVQYTVLWAQFLIVPLVMVIGLRSWQSGGRTKSSLLIGVAILIAIYIFALSGLKSAILSIIYCIGVWVVLRKDVFKVSKLYGLIAIIFSSGWILSYISRSDLLFWHVLRRFIITPGLNAGYYFELFHGADKMLLSHSILSSFAADDHAGGIGERVGEQFYFSVSGNATAGYLADAFANFGFAGVLLFGVILGLVLYFIDGINRDEDQRSASTAFAVQAYVLANTGLLTALMSYGLVLMAIAMHLMSGISSRQSTGRAGPVHSHV